MTAMWWIGARLSQQLLCSFAASSLLSWHSGSSIGCRMRCIRQHVAMTTGNWMLIFKCALLKWYFYNLESLRLAISYATHSTEFAEWNYTLSTSLCRQRQCLVHLRCYHDKLTCWGNFCGIILCFISLIDLRDLCAPKCPCSGTLEMVAWDTITRNWHLSPSSQLNSSPRKDRYICAHLRGAISWQGEETVSEDGGVIMQ